MSDDDSPELDALHAAVQALSNSMNEDDSDAGVVGQAVIVWEESSFTEDGKLRRAVLYAATGASASPAGTMGLLSLGKAQVEADLLGCDCSEE